MQAPPTVSFLFSVLTKEQRWWISWSAICTYLVVGISIGHMKLILEEKHQGACHAIIGKTLTELADDDE